MKLGTVGVLRPVGTTLLLGASAALPGAALAQSTELPTREQVELPTPDTDRQGPRIRVDARDAIATAPCPLERYDLQVAITKVEYGGVNGAALPAEIVRLLDGVAPPGPQQQPIAVVCGIRDRANAALRDAGYVASVQIPPQTIETGTLRLEVVTARIVEVRVRGDAAPYRDTLTARTEQLKALSPLNERDAERILLLAGDIPGLDVQLSLRPAGTAPGEVIGDLAVVYRPWSLLANISNYGSRQLGRESFYVRGEAYGLTGLADVTYVGASTTLDFEEQRVVQVGHLMGLGSRGTTLGGNFVYAWSRPDIGELDLRSESMIAGIELTTPLYRSVKRNVSVSGGFELIEQRTKVFGGAEGGSPLNRDKLRVVYLRLDGGYRTTPLDGGEGLRLQFGLEVRKGLDIFGTTERAEISPDGYVPSRFEGDPEAWVVRGDVDGTIGIGPIFSLNAQARAQWANNPLLNFEEYSLGNLTIGRGYDPGANSADRAIALRVEPRARVFQNARGRVDLFAFYDAVRIENLDSNTAETDRWLTSWGGGLRGIIPGFALLEAMYAHPEDKPLLIPEARRSPDRFLVSLTMQFLPRAR